MNQAAGYAPSLKLLAAIGLCLILLAVVSSGPLRVRAIVRDYDLSAGQDASLQQTLEALGDKAVPTLIERVLNPECRSRGRLVALLQTLAPDQSYLAFAEAAKEHHRPRRISAVDALGYLARPESRPLLERLALTEDTELRKVTQQALSRIQPAP